MSVKQSTIGGINMDIGVIGVGTMGKNHARIYSELKDVNNIYIYDVDRSKTKNIEKEYDAIFCDLDSLLHKADAVSICVPTKDHFKIAKKCFEKGIHCLIEKPVALNSRSGEELLKFLRENLIVGVGHIERFNPIVKEIKKVVVNPKYVEIKRHNPASSRINDASVVLDLMIHDIDLVWNYFFKDQSYVFYSFGDESVSKVMAKFNNCIISLSASKIANKKIRSIYVETEEFTVEGDFMNQEIYIYKKPGKYSIENEKYRQENIIEKVLINKVEPLKEELKTFINCVKNNKQFPVTLEEAILNLKIAEKIEGKA